MKKINLKKLVLIFILLFLILIYSMMIKPISADEIWEYGFGYNIAKGLVPYRDFNMIVTPLFPFCVSLFIKIFGPYLLSAHIFNAIILILMIAMMYKMIDNKTLIIVPLLLYSDFNILPTYNGLITFFTVLLVYIKQTEIKENKKILLSGLIISLMVLTKQSIGAVFFILELFLTKDKKKCLLTFSIPIIIFVIYLTINKSIYNFIDYSILGMIDFAQKNTYFSLWFIVFIIMCIILIYLYKKYKNNNILYALAFMSMCHPIYEMEHTLPSVIIFLITIFKFVNIKEFQIKYFILYLCILLVLYLSVFNNKINFKKNFLYGRNVGDSEYIKFTEESIKDINNLEKQYDKVYTFGGYLVYLTKLSGNKVIDKYDMILNGNIGYNGQKKYIEEIDNYCQNNKCIFRCIFKEVDKATKKKSKNQTNTKILEHIKKNYKYIGKSKSKIKDIYIYYYSN